MLNLYRVAASVPDTSFLGLRSGCQNCQSHQSQISLIHTLYLQEIHTVTFSLAELEK